MIVRGKRFTKGYRFHHFEGAPEERLVESGVPSEVVIPLRQGFGDEVSATVKKGDTVKAGQIIGAGEDTVSTPVHSTVNGTVEDFRVLSYLHGETNAVVIRSDGSSDWQTVDDGGAWTELSEEALERRLYLSGVTSLGKSGIPTRFGSSIIGSEDVEHIIIQGIGTDVFNTTFSVLFENNGVHHLAEGVKVLKRIMPKAAVHITFDKSNMRLIKQVDEAMSGIDGLKMYPLKARFPQECDEVIVPTILNRPYPYGYLPAHLGVIVLNVQAVMQVFEAAAENKPLIERVVALCGRGFKENRYVSLRVGSQIQCVQDLVKEEMDVRFVFNNLLTGFTCTDMTLPLDRTCNSITALPERQFGGFMSFASPGFKNDSHTKTFVASFIPFEKSLDTNLHGEERPCIFCGYCEDVCPVGIIPHLVYHNVERDKVEEHLAAYRIFNCMDCNLCTYVCPSKIPVASYVLEGKDKLREMGIDESTVILPDFQLKGIEMSNATEEDTD